MFCTILEITGPNLNSTNAIKVNNSKFRERLLYIKKYTIVFFLLTILIYERRDILKSKNIYIFLNYFVKK